MMCGKRRRAFPVIVSALVWLYIAGCTISTVNTGGSSGTEVSTVTGRVVDPDGNLFANARVRIRPAEFLTDSSKSPSYVSTHTIIDTVTGADGSFSVIGILPDFYTVEIACDDTSGAMAQFHATSNDRGPIQLPTLIALPLAQLSGNVQIGYNVNASGIVQVYGLDRTDTVDVYGNFTILVPQGNYTIHMGGYAKDSIKPAEFDGIDLSCKVGFGEDKNIGSCYLRPPPPPPCLDGSCDSAVVRHILDAVGLPMIRIDEVTEVADGRIVTLNLRGRPLPNGIPPDVNKLIELENLDLGKTGLSVMFPDLGRMTELTIIRLDSNHIPVFSSSIGNCTLLKELRLNGNELTALPQSIVNLNGLTSFSVGGNRLCQVDSTMAAWIDRYDPVWRTNQRCQ